jgi:hypothetical protein
VAQRFDQLGFVAAPMGPREFGTFTRAEIDKWTRVVRAGNVTAE